MSGPMGALRGPRHTPISLRSSMGPTMWGHTVATTVARPLGGPGSELHSWVVAIK